MKSTKEMRSFLIEQMGAVANGDQDIATAKGVCNYAQQVYNTMNIEIKHAQAQAKLGEGDIKEVKF
jgi:hypothetical protein